jgi:nitrate/nitrite transporter NarK
VGTGIGFGYSAATPPALKWFPPEKTGLIAGLVVSGFGLASVYIAPLATYLIKIWGLQQSMLFFGVAFTVVVCGLSLLLKNPPEGYVPVPVKKTGPGEKKPNLDFIVTIDMKPSQIIKKYEFYLLWVTYAFASGVGLMVIGSVAGMAKKSLGTYAFLAVAILAIGNAGGRIIAGILSDKIGRTNTLIIMLGFQAALMFTAIPVLGAESPSAVLLVLLATFIGFNYGTNLSLFPSITKDLWGLKNFGGNYGILFTSWGVGGFVLARVSQMIKADSGSFTNSFLIAGGLLIIGMAHILLLKAHLKGMRENEKEAVKASNLAN